MTELPSTKYPKHYSSLFYVRRSAGQNVNSGVWTAIQWDFQDVDLMEEMLIVNPWTFTPTQAGYYLLRACVRVTLLNVADIAECRIRYDGTTTIAYQYKTAHALNEDLHVNVFALAHLTPNNAVEVDVRHNFGAIRVIGGGAHDTFFSGFRVS